MKSIWWFGKAIAPPLESPLLVSCIRIDTGVGLLLKLTVQRMLERERVSCELPQTPTPSSPMEAPELLLSYPPPLRCPPLRPCRLPRLSLTRDTPRLYLSALSYCRDHCIHLTSSNMVLGPITPAQCTSAHVLSLSLLTGASRPLFG